MAKIQKATNTMTKKGGFSVPNFSRHQTKGIATRGPAVRNTNKPSPHRNTSTVR